MHQLLKNLTKPSKLKPICLPQNLAINSQFQSPYFINLTKQINRSSLLKNPYFAFSTSTSDPLANLTFEQLLQLKSTQSLTKAAQIMAELEIQNENLDSQLLKLQQEFQEFPEHYQALMEKIRTVLDNVKLQEHQNTQILKRAEKYLFPQIRELEDAKKYAISKVAKEVLEVSDNLERSIKHSEKICQETHSSVKKFHKQLQDVFKKFGIEQFDPVGKQYDPNTQESMVKLPLPTNMNAQQKAKKSNTVVECFRTGYKIKGRLLRSAHVVVYE